MINFYKFISDICFNLYCMLDKFSILFLRLYDKFTEKYLMLLSEKDRHYLDREKEDRQKEREEER